MKISSVTNSFSASDQVMAKDFELIATLRFTTNKNQVADGEYAGQPNLVELSNATKKYRINAHFLAVTSKKISYKNSTALNNALTKAV